MDSSMYVQYEQKQETRGCCSIFSTNIWRRNGKITFLQKLKKFLHAHWLIFIVKQTDTWIYNLSDASKNESGSIDNFLS